MNERLSLLTVLLLLGGAVVGAMLWLSGDAESLVRAVSPSGRRGRA